MHSMHQEDAEVALTDETAQMCPAEAFVNKMVVAVSEKMTVAIVGSGYLYDTLSYSANP